MIKYLVKKYLRRKYEKLNEKCNEITIKLGYVGSDGDIADYYANKLQANRDLAICYMNVIKSL